MNFNVFNLFRENERVSYICENLILVMYILLLLHTLSGKQELRAFSVVLFNI